MAERSTQKKKSSDIDLYDILKQDHRKAMDIMNKIQKEESGSTRDKLFAALKHDLDIHMKAEEEVFYPALENEEETHQIALEAIEEHHVASLLLKELDKMSKESDRWKAKMSVLKENVQQHIKEEEGEMFDEARSIFSEEQSKDMGRRVTAIEKQRTPSPRTAPKESTVSM